MNKCLPLTVILLLSSLSVAQAADCQQILGTHGFKAQAQFSCGYGQRRNQLMDWARTCARTQDPGVNAAEINQGALVFRASEARMGHAALCRDVLVKFPGIFIVR